MTEPSSTPSNFIYDAVNADVAGGSAGVGSRPRFPPELRTVRTSARRPSSWTSEWRRTSAGSASCGSTTRTPRPRTPASSRASSTTSSGWANEPADVRFASDYFEQLYAWAEQLITAGLAYVDDQDSEAISPAAAASASPASSLRSGTGRWRPTWTSSGGCAPASSRTAHGCCGPRST